MPALDDRKMNHLSDLFSQGALNNAPEIAKLIKVELGKRPDRLANIEIYRKRVLRKLLPFLRQPLS